MSYFATAEFGRHFDSFSLRHLGGDLLSRARNARPQVVWDPPRQLCVEVVLALHIGQIESNPPELADFVWRKACRVARTNHRIGAGASRSGMCRRLSAKQSHCPRERDSSIWLLTFAMFFGPRAKDLFLTQVLPCSISNTSAHATLARRRRSRSISRT